ncbi:MAG: hypothetical protein KGL45_05705 [Gammaproteobacteria bacterium]|nr:hypothetical protein [Gammaproteobacteria bacterium]
MPNRHLLPGFLLFLASCMPSAALAQSATAGGGAELSQLDISAGRWVYHGRFIGAGARPGAWTWHEDCRWSANRAFMLCSFSNTWAGRHVDSVVADTYNRRDETFWHYEIFDDARSADKPFAARMRIEGPTRIESWTEKHDGKTVHQRIVYKFASANTVTVLFQQSEDGTHWKTTASGTGEKTGMEAGLR